MTRMDIRLFLCLLSLPVLAALTGCNKVEADQDSEAPPPARAIPGADISLLTVDHPEQYPLVAAAAKASASELVVTGVVSPDVSRNVPVVSLASGRVEGIYARLGDAVQIGQLLLRIRSDDVSGGFSNYRKAVADELLTRAQLERTKDLFEHGAMAQSDLEIAQDAEDKAKVDLETMAEHLRLLGNDPTNSNFTVDIHAPVSGLVTDQQVTNSAFVQVYGTPALMTISDLSNVWVVCDVSCRGD